MVGDVQLAVLARSAQWALDEAAFELAGGRYSDEQCVSLADQLTDLADVLRDAAKRPMVIESPTSGDNTGDSAAQSLGR